jgi:hypothetical protein
MHQPAAPVGPPVTGQTILGPPLAADQMIPDAYLGWRRVGSGHVPRVYLQVPGDRVRLERGFAW